MNSPRKSITKSKSSPKAGATAKPRASKPKPAKLLSGGNPQIAKAEGDAPVQAYIAAYPAGSATSRIASTRSSCAPCPTCARP
jgi:hypothetical protein